MLVDKFFFHNLLKKVESCVKYDRSVAWLNKHFGANNYLFFSERGSHRFTAISTLALFSLQNERA